MNMFTKRQDEDGYPSSGHVSPTIIAHGVKLEGDFSSQGDVTIEGHMTGNVRVGGVLTIGSQASVQADVTADQASIAGIVEGNMVAAGHVELKATAKLMGDLTCATIEVESGAVLSGRVQIGTTENGTKKARAAEKTPPAETK